VKFHDASKDTYVFMADKIIEIDKFNPQVATRVASTFDFWKSLEFPQKQKAHREIERMLRAGLSKNTYEIVSKQLVE
jgi:aminopeptidase N